MEAPDAVSRRSARASRRLDRRVRYELAALNAPRRKNTTTTTIATWSTRWNFGPGWEPTLLDAYGVEPDPSRTRYYRLLWDLGP